MKKYLIIFLSIFSIFFISNNVYALEFTATDGNTYQVTDEETFRDYCYYTYVKPNSVNLNRHLLVYSYSANESVKYRCVPGIYTRPYISNNRLYTTAHYEYIFSYKFVYNSATSTNGFPFFTILYISRDVFTDDTYTDVYFNANFSYNDIESKYGIKTYHTITYYLNNEVYNSYEVEEHTNYTLIDYIPPEHYSFSGWSYDSNIDITDITESFNIYGTTTYVRPNMNYSEDINSPIHELSIKILGRNIPVEFDFVYTIMDYLILISLIFCILMPFIIVIKLLGGKF